MRNHRLHFLLISFLWLTSILGASWFQRAPFRVPITEPFSPHHWPRGGATESSTDANEEERYSRQVFAVGKRAHGLIRSSTIYLDGPAASGLVYETAKNLALSGIRKLVFLVPSDDDESAKHDQSYHNQPFDDLGNAYLRAARAELDDETSDSVDILASYVKHLNPSIDVSILRDRKSLVDHDTTVRNVLLVLDRPYRTQVRLNKLARTNGMSFVSVETAGLFGRIFCDFGPSFEVYDADGETPLETPLLRVEQGSDPESEEDDKFITIRCVDGEKHDVSKGDIVRFKFRNGEVSSTSCVVEKVQTPFKFVASIREESDSNDIDSVIAQWNEAASFSRTKIPQEVSFVGLEEAVSKAQQDSTLFTACDLDKSWDETRRKTVFGCFQTLSAFAKVHERLPKREDRKTFTALFKENTYDEEVDKPAKSHIKNFVSGCAAKFGLLQAIFGAIGAQEALKAVTGLYSPVKQFLLYDCDEVLDPKSMGTSTEELDSHNYDAGIRYILGEEIVDEIQSKRIFVVGAGAIGCEILKNLAAMGVGTKDKGKIISTDMDTIEKSNLSRQFLFRDSDIGKFKSLAAKDSVLRFQPAAKIEAHSTKVGSDESVFDERFWEKKVDVVLNALDNVDARVFIDGQCVANQKALVDAGTLGPKGNVQVVVPFQSESYSSSVDPPDEAIPVCTLKNFPYAISHTIQWGRDLFDGCFRAQPVEANKVAASLAESSIDIIASQTISLMGEEAVVTWAENLVDDLHIPSDPDDAVPGALDWAVKLAWKLFYKAMHHLLEEHPLGSSDDDGELFWSGSRRPPSPVKFLKAPSSREEELINQNLIDFVRLAARLRLESYKSLTEKGLSVTEEDAKAALVHFDFELQECEGSGDEDDSIDQRIRSLLEPLKAIKTFPEMTIAEFEKDDDSNGHVAFVTAASNLRAICYGIPPVDAMETRRIAGNIIPAMISTTAFVSALSCVEMIKLVQGASLKKHRNAFINLALPFFAFTVPLPAEPTAGLGGREYTLWDRLFIKESKKAASSGGMKLRSLLSKIKKLASDEPSDVAVSSISMGPYLLYASFLHEDDDDLLQSSVWDVIAEALEDPDEGAREEDADTSARTYSVDSKKFDLTVVVEDVETGEEVELPAIYLERYSGK